MRDIAWSIFDRTFPLVCFLGGAWFHRSILRASAVIDRARESVRD